MKNAITVWKDGTWKVWQAMDAQLAENDYPDILVTIPLPQPLEPECTNQSNLLPAFDEKL